MELLSMATSGLCCEFAVALQKELGLPLGAFFEVGKDGWEEGDFVLIHAFAYLSPQIILDALGEREKREAEKELYSSSGGKVVEKEVTQNFLDSLFMEGLDEEAINSFREIIRDRFLKTQP